LEWHRNVGFGINRSSKMTFGWEGYEFTFEDLNAARAFILRLVV